MKKTTAETINSLSIKRKLVGGVLTKIRSIYCLNGLSLSVQASQKHKCYPRNNEGPYTEFEVGFPSQKPPESWRQFCVGDFNLKACDTVYANVPLALIVEFIDLHGGIREEQMPQLVLPESKEPIKRTFIEQRRFNIAMQDAGLAS